MMDSPSSKKVSYRFDMFEIFIADISSIDAYLFVSLLLDSPNSDL